jgi:hypothetical protein
MFRTRVSIAAALLLSASIAGASAQSMTPPAAAAPDAPKMSRLKLTKQKISEMRAQWKANRPKLKACRAEVKKQGLAGDERWFFISDCMAKS